MADLKHSKFSASAAHRWLACPGSIPLSVGKGNQSSVYADEGTAAHTLLSWVMGCNRAAADYLGESLAVGDRTFVVDDDMATAVQTAADNIRQIVGDGIVQTDRQVNYSSYLGVPKADAWGTSDIIAARGAELQVHDYKHGRGVEVDAKDNAQMMLYALGALEEVNDVLGPFETVRLAIHQPRIKDAPSEWTLTVAALEAWGLGRARSGAASVQLAERDGAADITGGEYTFLNPGEDQCRFCPAKVTCPALRAVVQDTLGLHAASPDEFADAHTECAPDVQDDAWLAVFMDKAALIEDWLKAVRAEVERRLLAGLPIKGWKIVQGKQGNRSWSSVADAEAALKTMRLKIEEMYDLTLISPTTAEKLAKAKKGAPAPVIGPRQWTKLQPLITRASGKPHVAPASDPREAMATTPVADDFDDVVATFDDLA